MDISTATETIKSVIDSLISAHPESDLMITADLLVGAVMEEINEHIDDYVICYEIW